ncbi:MAG: YtxH domain-containing protein [Parachlamydia sp.]|nr:YtxH domain-containing protein [Parachlamydia sp.]
MKMQADFIKGALVGSLVGSVAGLLFAPLSGRKLREEIVDECQHFCGNGKGTLETVKENLESQETFLVGGAVGAIVGVIAALLLAPQSGKELRDVLGDKYEHIREDAETFLSKAKDKGKDAWGELEEQAGDWKETLQMLVEKLASGKKKGQSSLDEIVDWANMGLRFMKQLNPAR